jgi:translocation and assembly module TamB
MRVLLRILIIAFFCIAVMLVYVSTTQRGLKLLWQSLQPLLPAGLSIESIEGRLTGPLAVTGLKFRNDDFDLSLNYAELEWTLPRLLSGVLQLDRLVLEDVRYTPSEQAAPVAAEPMAMPERIALPIEVNLDQLEVRNFAFDTVTGSQAFVIEQGDASLSYEHVALEIHHVSIHSTEVQIQGGARLETAGDYPLEGVLDWRLSPPAYTEIQGRTTLSGTLQRLLVTQTFNDAYPVTGDFVLAGLLDNLSLEARVRVDGLKLKAINDDMPDMSLLAEFQADGPVDALSLSGSLDIDNDQLPTVHANVSAKLSTDRVELEQLLLTVSAHQTELRVSGPVDFETDAMQFDLDADWSRARWPLEGTAQLESPSGQLRLRGSLDDYRVDSQITLAAPGYTDANLSLQGSGNQDALQLSELAIDTLNGHLQGTAMLAWRPQLETNIDLNGSSLDPGLIFAEWPGQLDVQLTSRAEFSSAGIVAQLPRLSVSGQLRDLPVQLETQGGYQKDTLVIEKLALVSGPSSLQLSGAIGASLDLDWRLNSPDLNTLLPAASGRLAGEGRISGTFAAPLGRARLNGSDLRYGNDRLSDIKLDAAVDITAASESSLQLKLGKGMIQGITINSMDLRADGIPTQHGVKLSADSSLVHGQLEAQGNWEHKVWHFDLQKAKLGHADFAPWTLHNSFRGQLGQGNFAADPSCWHSGGARLCLSGEFTPGTGNGEVELRDLPLGYFASLLPAGVEAQGTLELDGGIKQQEGQPATTQLRLGSHALALVSAGQGDRPDVRIEASSATLNLHGDEESTRLDASILLDNDAKLSLDASISGTDEDFVSRALTGNTSIEIPDIGFLDYFTPHIGDAQGALQGRVQFGGSLQAPVFQGLISTSDTRLTLDQPGITLEEVQMTLEGQPNGNLALDLAARSGDGQLSIKGESKLHAEPRSARFRITGDDFQVMDTREAKVSTSPDLNLAVDGDQIDIEGEIAVPSASIRPRKLPESSVSVSADQIIVSDDEETTAAKNYQISSRVRFILGEQVKFDGFGLRGRITGNLISKDQPGKPTTASGELAIQDGTYRAYGQNLDIRTGRLLFAGGPITQPGLDIEAVRRPAPGILVGVKARGSMRKPDFSLFSEPGMSQSDQLSWLVLGRPLESNTSSQDKNSMNQAAIMLGLGGGLALTEEFGEKVGIDEISIESDPSDETNQASLLVGKYLSPKLFVSYGVGIFEPVSTLRLRYALGSKWKLVGESSALRSGADLFYVIELGK